MNWPALWNDGWVISVHAVVALVAIGLGTVQVVLPKGTPMHRTLGYIWVALMAGVAGSSFFIHEFRHFGAFSAIHVLSGITLVALAYGVVRARGGQIAAHRATMRQLYVIALILTGAFTLLPGRTMHAVFFGN